MNENEGLLAGARLDDAWPLVELFSTIRREHPDDGNRAAQEIVKRLTALGVPVKVYEPQLYLTLPQGAHVEAEGRKLFARPAPMSRAAPQGVEAPLVFVAKPINPPAGWDPASAVVFGEGYDPAPGTPDLTGKIVVQNGMISSERIMAVETLGAAGIIFVNPGKYAHWGGGSYTWGTADLDDLPYKPGIPAVSVNKADGEALIALAGKGGRATIVHEVRGRLVQEPAAGGGDSGRSEPEKFVLLHGHYDSWDVGVGDNATGDAAMLEIARVLWQNRDKLERSVRIAWWPGHSTGRFAGSTWYADEFALDLARNCLAHLNCDSPGCRDATDYIMIPWMAENAGFVKGVVKDAAGKDAEGKRPSQSSDFSFNNLGITGFFSSSSRIPKKEIEKRGYYYVMGNGGNLEWHTDDDLMPVADRDILLTDIKVYALAAFRLANAPLLPWDWRALLKEFDGSACKVSGRGGRAVRPEAGARCGCCARCRACEVCGSGLGRPRDACESQRGAAEAFAPPGAAQLHPRHALAARSQRAGAAADGACGRKRPRPLSGVGLAVRADASQARHEPGAGGARGGSRTRVGGASGVSQLSRVLSPPSS